MNTSFGQHGINHATVAICLEMNPLGRKRQADADTLFFGGTQPTEADHTELAGFGLRKNYQLVFASFDPADPLAGPTSLDAVVTDGVSEVFGLKGGRLWKRDRRTAAVLLFPEIGALVRISTKGRLVVREMKGRFHDQGFDFAREAVVARAACKPGHVPVMAPIGNLMTVMDMRTLAATFEAA